MLPPVPPLKRRSVDIDPKLRAEWRSAEQGQQLLLQQQRQASTSPSSSAQRFRRRSMSAASPPTTGAVKGPGKKHLSALRKARPRRDSVGAEVERVSILNSHSNISRHLNIAGEKNLFLPHSKISFLPTSASPVFPSPPPPPSRTGGKLTRMPFDLLAPNFPLQTRLLSSCQVLRPRAQRPLLRQRSRLPLDRRQVSHDIYAGRDRRRRGQNRVVPGDDWAAGVSSSVGGAEAAEAAAAEIPTAPRPGSARPLRGLRSLPDGGPQRLRDRGAGLARRVGEQVVLRRGAATPRQGSPSPSPSPSQAASSSGSLSSYDSDENGASP